MSQINYENDTTGDDAKLIALLTQQVDVPSNELVNKTMERLAEARAHKKYSYTPLKFPAYIMAFILFIMIMPSLLSIEFDVQNVHPTEFIADPIVRYLSWAWLAISLLLVATVVSRLNLKSVLKIFSV